MENLLFENENYTMNISLSFLLLRTFLISGSTIVNAKQKFCDYDGDIT